MKEADDIIKMLSMLCKDIERLDKDFGVTRDTKGLMIQPASV
jgi:hypothetical protein